VLVQSTVVSDRLREDLLQPRCDDARCDVGDRGRHAPGQNTGDHRNAPLRALPMETSATGLHRQERLGEEEASAGSAVVVGQAATGSDPHASGCVLRTAVLQPLTRVPAGPGMSHRAAIDLPRMARYYVVRRGRHRPVFRQARPFDLTRDTGREDPRQPVPAVDRRAASGRLPGGMALPHHAFRQPARGYRQSLAG
jgi:hypothetical protein